MSSERYRVFTPESLEVMAKASSQYDNVTRALAEELIATRNELARVRREALEQAAKECDSAERVFIDHHNEWDNCAAILAKRIRALAGGEKT